MMGRFRRSTMRKGRGAAAPFLAALLVFGSATPGWAALWHYDIVWTSVGPGTAVGSMTIDDSVLLNPGSSNSSSIPWVTDFSVTISGALSGNGTFTLADFSNINLNSNGCTLALGEELVGQNNGGLFDPVGNGGLGGDFNIFASAPDAPNGSNYGTFTVAGGSSQLFELASISPPPVLFPFSAEEKKCQDAIGKAASKYAAKRHKILAGCRSALMKGSSLFEDEAGTTPVLSAANCPDELKAKAKVAKERQKLRGGLEKKCTDAILANLYACAPTLDGLADSTGSTGCLVTSVDQNVDDLLTDEYGF